MPKKLLVCGGMMRRENGQFYTMIQLIESLRLYAEPFPEASFVQDLQNDPALSHPVPDDFKVIPIEEDKLIAKKGLKLLDWVLEGKLLPAQVKKAIEEHDIIHFRIPWHSAMSAYQYAKKFNKPYFVTVFGDWEEVYRKKFYGYPFPLEKAGKLFADWVDQNIRSMLRGAKAAFFIGHKLMEKYSDEVEYKAATVDTFHYEKDIIQTPKEIRNHPPYRVIFAGELAPRKGIVQLMEGWLKLLSEGVETELHILGDGVLREKMIEMAEKAGKRHLLHLHGFVTERDELLRHFRESDIFILPSIAGEGVPKVILEAMTQGLPIVTTTVGDSETILKNGEAGVLLPPGDVDAIKNALKELLLNPEKRAFFSKKSVEVAKEYTRDKQREKVYRILRQTVPEFLKD